MIPDVCFEASVLRTARLLGLVRELDVRSWADELLESEIGRDTLLADVSLARPELTAVREALRPLAEPADEPAVAAAILTMIASDPVAAALSLRDRHRVLMELRSEVELPASVSDDIKLFEDRARLAAV